MAFVSFSCRPVGRQLFAVRQSSQRVCVCVCTLHPSCVSPAPVNGRARRSATRPAGSRPLRSGLHPEPPKLYVGRSIFSRRSHNANLPSLHCNPAADASACFRGIVHAFPACKCMVQIRAIDLHPGVPMVVEQPSVRPCCIELLSEPYPAPVRIRKQFRADQHRSSPRLRVSNCRHSPRIYPPRAGPHRPSFQRSRRVNACARVQGARHAARQTT